MMISLYTKWRNVVWMVVKLSGYIVIFTKTPKSGLYKGVETCYWTSSFALTCLSVLAINPE
jgi:hypothetical protein